MNNDTTLLIKLPVELKGAFKLVADSKGVTVSEYLRSYMRSEIQENIVNKGSSSAVKDSLRCKDTLDMFDSNLPAKNIKRRSKKRK